MATKIITKLNTISFGSYRDSFKQAGRHVAPSLIANCAINEKARKALFTLVQSYARKLDTPIGKITQTTIFDKSNKPIGDTSSEFQNKFRSIVEKGRINLSEGLAPAAIEKVNEPEPELNVNGVANVRFENIRNTHHLDQITYPRREAFPEETRESHIHRITKTLGGKKYDSEKQKTRESLIGVSQSIVPRENYRMTVEPQGELKTFLNGQETFTSTEIFAKNGYVDGAVVSSFHRYSERVTLMRSIEAEDGSIDWLAGRVSNLETAQSMASFAFLSELKSTSPQGIKKNPDSTYDFSFMAQSVLPMFGGGETEMVKQEMKAYQELASLSKPMEITDPGDSSQIYRVHFRPLPVAASQFNWAQTLEKILPSALSGENAAREATAKTDGALISLSKTVDQAERAKALNLDLKVYRDMLRDTVYFLEKEKKNLKPYEELMTRSFLCHLLGIPQIIHCKSCVDRTNVAGALVTATKQWLRAGKEILKNKEERYAIFDLPKQTIGEMHPFKELFVFSLHKGLKLTEFSRGSKGYKWLENFAEALTLHPAMCDLLPARYLTPTVNSRKVVAAKVAAIALTLIVRLVFYVLSWICFWNVWDRLDVHPIQVVKDVTRAFFPKVKIKREYEDVDERSLLKR